MGAASPMSKTMRSTGTSTCSRGSRSMRSCIGGRDSDDPSGHGPQFGTEALMAAHYAKGLPSAGVFAGPVAWALSTQTNYALVPWTCAHQIRVIPIVALVLAIASLTGGYFSWQAYRTSRGLP